MFENPENDKQPKRLGGGSYRGYWRWQQLRLIIVTAIVLIPLLVVISGWIQTEMWMRQLVYGGIF